MYTILLMTIWLTSSCQTLSYDELYDIVTDMSLEQLTQSLDNDPVAFDCIQGHYAEIKLWTPVKNEKSYIIKKITKDKGIRDRLYWWKIEKNVNEFILKNGKSSNVAKMIQFSFVNEYLRNNTILIFEKANGTTAYLPNIVRQMEQLNMNVTVPALIDIYVDIVMETQLMLSDLHSIGVYHFDIKASNIIYDLVTNQITLIDFGISHIFDIAQRYMTADGYNNKTGNQYFMSSYQSFVCHCLERWRTQSSDAPIGMSDVCEYAAKNDYYSLGVAMLKQIFFCMEYETGKRRFEEIAIAKHVFQPYCNQSVSINGYEPSMAWLCQSSDCIVESEAIELIRQLICPALPVYPITNHHKLMQ